MLVGLAAGIVAGKRLGLAGFLLAAVVSALVHEALDAPVAQVLSDLGA